MICLNHSFITESILLIKHIIVVWIMVQIIARIYYARVITKDCNSYIPYIGGYRAIEVDVFMVSVNDLSLVASIKKMKKEIEILILKL